MSSIPLHEPAGQPRPARSRRPTSTARFGSSRRESHDSSAFYRRFTAPELSTDSSVGTTKRLDAIHRADARQMKEVGSSSVALVVTSPPYFAGKEYEESLGQNGVPGSYFEYLELLREVFEECKRVLEPGGRIAVNVANLGRRPYRSLSADVGDVLQSLGLLMRGEVVWWKGRAAGGSCAWGTFQHPSNPVLRDVTERVVIASKGRFERAPRPEKRAEIGLPSVATISRDEFLEATTDLWEMPPESATRVGHPAPFPVELPQRLIELYTYENDLVLDPFMGSGTTAIAAMRSRRHFVGYDTDASYVRRARERVARERRAAPADARTREGTTSKGSQLVAPRLKHSKDDTQRRSKKTTDPNSGEPSQRRSKAFPEHRSFEPLEAAVREGRLAKELAGILLECCGFFDVERDVKVPRLGVELSFVARDQEGGSWAFDLWGAFTTNRAGLRRADTIFRALGKAAVLAAAGQGRRLVLLTTDIPAKGSSGDAAIRSLVGEDRPVFDVIELFRTEDIRRLEEYALGKGKGKQKRKGPSAESPDAV